MPDLYPFKINKPCTSADYTLKKYYFLIALHICNKAGLKHFFCLVLNFFYMLKTQKTNFISN